jgi:hypothetical protein
MNNEQSLKRKRDDHAGEDVTFETDKQTDEDIILEAILVFLSKHLKPTDSSNIGHTNASNTSLNLMKKVARILQDLGLSGQKQDGKYDTLIWFSDHTNESFNKSRSRLSSLVRPGGICIFIVPNTKYPMLEEIFVTNGFHGVDTMLADQEQVLVCYRHNFLTKVNNLSLTEPVFLDRPIYFQENPDTSDFEKNILNAITVSPNFQERNAGRLDEISHQLVVQCLEKYGVCVVEGLFQPTAIGEWGDSVEQDMNEIVRALKDHHNIDILNVKEADNLASNFLEISTREGLRFDVRCGNRLNALNENADQRENQDAEATVITETASSSSSSLSEHRPLSRRHPSILAVVKDMFNPTSPYYDGNWGKYNFNGGGIGSVPEPVVSPIGCVISEPGAKSQKIHADTPHLIENQQLPPHYINCFLPIVDDHNDLTVGQTGFFVGTHVLSESAKFVRSIQSEDEGKELMKRSLIRPHLRTGDCLLFDTRIFHFGLPNVSQSTRRCILYINFTQHWFARQRTDKNWGKISCFDSGSRPEGK